MADWSIADTEADETLGTREKTMPHESPIRRIAVHDIGTRFSDLISFHARLSAYEQNLFEGCYETIVHEGWDRDRQRTWERVVRASHFFLERGAEIAPDQIASAFLDIADHITHALNQCHQSLVECDRMDTDESDNRILGYLAAYKLMYERLARTVMAPVIRGFALTKNVTTKSFDLEIDGRANLNAIDRMEELLIQPDNILAHGLNGHIRNAYAHERYSLLDGNRVELRDAHPRDHTKDWGPEIWTAETLRALCSNFYTTLLGVVTALAIYAINHSREIHAPGLERRTVSPPMRESQLRNLVGHSASLYDFDVTSFDLTGDLVSIELSTRPRGIDQDSKIIVAGPRRTRRLVAPLRFHESLVAAEVIDFLLSIAPYFSTYRELTARITADSGEALGELTLPAEVIRALTGPNRPSLAAARQLLLVDTLGNTMMSRREVRGLTEE